MGNEFCPYRDCEFYQAYDEGDDYPPIIKCGKTFDIWKKWKVHTTKCGKEKEK